MIHFPGPDRFWEELLELSAYLYLLFAAFAQRTEAMRMRRGTACPDLDQRMVQDGQEGRLAIPRRQFTLSCRCLARPSRPEKYLARTLTEVVSISQALRFGAVARHSLRRK